MGGERWITRSDGALLPGQLRRVMDLGLWDAAPLAREAIDLFARERGAAQDDRGEWDEGELGLPGIAITLTGTDGMGNTIESRSM